MRDVLRQLIAAIRAGQPVAWCRLVETRGSTPQKAGAAMLVYEDGSQAGTLGGGCVEAEVKRRALALVAENRPQPVIHIGQADVLAVVLARVVEDRRLHAHTVILDDDVALRPGVPRQNADHPHPGFA